MLSNIGVGDCIGDGCVEFASEPLDGVCSFDDNIGDRFLGCMFDVSWIVDDGIE